MRRIAAVFYVVIAALALKRVGRVSATSPGAVASATRSRIAFLLVGVAAVVVAIDRAGVPAWIPLAALLALLWRSGLSRWALAELGVDAPGPWVFWGAEGAPGELAGAAGCPPGRLCLGLDGTVVDRTGAT